MQTTLRRDAPCEMFRGSAVTDHNMVYITLRGTNSIYQYHVRDDKWKKLPSSFCRDSGLVVRDNTLVAIGGKQNYNFMKKVFSLRGKKWKEDLPPLNNARSSPAVATHSIYIFVIGGYCDYNTRVDTVEMLDQYSTWTMLNRLPHPLYHPSAIVCGSKLYVVGDYDDGYSCSLSQIATSSHPMRSPPAITWTPMPPSPVTYSTIACLSNKPLLVGGKDRNTFVDSRTIYILSQGQWMECGSLSVGRSRCLVASLSEKEMVVVGGYGRNSLELCSVV